MLGLDRHPGVRLTSGQAALPWAPRQFETGHGAAGKDRTRCGLFPKGGGNRLVSRRGRLGRGLCRPETGTSSPKDSPGGSSCLRRQDDHPMPPPGGEVSPENTPPHRNPADAACILSQTLAEHLETLPSHREVDAAMMGRHGQGRGVSPLKLQAAQASKPPRGGVQIPMPGRGSSGPALAGPDRAILHGWQRREPERQLWPRLAVCGGPVPRPLCASVSSSV